MTDLPRPGDVLGEKYRIERLLAAGGMGVVMAARHLALDEPVAIKFLRPGLSSNQELVARFAREARAALKIKNEHVVRILDVGALPDGAPYIVMEYLEGVELENLAQKEGRLPAAQVVEFMLQAGEAIAEAHALGIVHRDLKPSNLFVVRRGDGLPAIKVFDFGISKMAGPSLYSAVTGAEGPRMMGSPHYMSPEQLGSAGDVDARTDIWAIGVMLYQLLTGTYPFHGESLPKLCMTIVSDPITPPRELEPNLAEGLSAVVVRCLEKQREHRFADIGELATALAPFAPARARASAERAARTMEAARSSEPLPISDPMSRTALPPGPVTRAARMPTSAPPVTAMASPAPARSKRGNRAIVPAVAVLAVLLVADLLSRHRAAGNQGSPTVVVALPETAAPAVDEVPPPVTAEPAASEVRRAASQVRAAAPLASTRSVPRAKPGKTPSPAAHAVAPHASSTVRVEARSFNPLPADLIDDRH